MQVIQSIQNRIYEIRGGRVMLDFDLAQLYEVETKVLNQPLKEIASGFQRILCSGLQQVSGWGCGHNL
jgi:ORF6N domain